jgi:type IV secretory pathway TrbL component
MDILNWWLHYPQFLLFQLLIVVAIGTIAFAIWAYNKDPLGFGE